MQSINQQGRRVMGNVRSASTLGKDSAPPAPVALVPGSVEMIEVAVSDLDDAINNIILRISSVIRNEPGNKSSDTASRPTSSVPLAGRLLEQASRLQELNQRLYYLSSLIEL